MNTIITLVQFFAALGLIVTLHELGHFLAARAFGIKVEKFYLFFDAFGVKLFKFKKGDTEYGIGWLPLGGYVKIAGMVDESLDKEQLKTDPEPWEFRSKPAWQRLIVMIGGVVVNVILGILIISCLTFSQGETFVPTSAINERGGIYVSPEAKKWGLQTGDKIVALNDEKVENLMGSFMSPEFLTNNRKDVTLLRIDEALYVSLRQNIENSFSMSSDLPLIAPRYQFDVKLVVGGSPAAKAGVVGGDAFVSIDSQEFGSFFEFKEILTEKAGQTAEFVLKSEDGNFRKTYITISEEGTLGFQPKIKGFEGAEKKISYSAGSSLVLGAQKSYELIAANAKGLGKVISGKVSAKNSLAGPIGMAQMYGPIWDWINFWTLTATISLALALMNILPIPALDGGHVMFLLYEMITRRPVNEKVLYIGQLIGMVVLLSLFVFIFWVDISRALGF